MGINTDHTIPPSPTQFEFSLLGRGSAYGESIVLHLGDNKWGIIDTCLNPKTKIPIALEYLNDISVPFNNVVFIISTHWHQDHVTGIASLVEQCKKAEIYLSAALNCAEYKCFIGFNGDIPSQFNPARAFKKLIDYIKKSNRRLKTVVQDKVLFRGQIAGKDLILTALSPNDATINYFQQTQLKELYNITGGIEKSITKPEPNLQSIVSLLTIENFGVLFGADLELTKDAELGWQGVLQSKMISQKASIFKVPHHGSENGFDKDIWNRLLTSNPNLGITPIKTGRTILPNPTMINELLNYASNSHITTNPYTDDAPKHSHDVRRAIKSTKLNIKKLSYKLGHIRFRKDFSACTLLSCELFGTASHLSELVVV